MANVRKPIPYQIVNGLRFPSRMSKDCIEEAFRYVPRDDDVIIDTYPKCGTTWMQMVAIQIFRSGKALGKPIDFMIASPFLEMVGEEGVARMPRPGPIKTHLPYDVIPHGPRTKYIFVIRNPMDTCVSLYHHTYLKPGFGFWNGSFDDFFELFMEGEVEFNDYFDHLLSWYPHRHDANVYWTTYETMKKDLKPVVLQVAEFLGKEYYEMVQRDNAVMNKILEHSSFAYMKDMYSRLEASRKLDPDPDLPRGLRYLYVQPDNPTAVDSSKITPHIRKGIVGDWKEYFSVEQEARMKAKFNAKTSGTDISELWPDLFAA